MKQTGKEFREGGPCAERPLPTPKQLSLHLLTPATPWTFSLLRMSSLPMCSGERGEGEGEGQGEEEKEGEGQGEI
jgi:hypothetical protein